MLVVSDRTKTGPGKILLELYALAVDRLPVYSIQQSFVRGYRLGQHSKTALKIYDKPVLCETFGYTQCKLLKVVLESVCVFDELFAVSLTFLFFMETMFCQTKTEIICVPTPAWLTLPDNTVNTCV
jgi:hypothetical protein